MLAKDRPKVERKSKPKVERKPKKRLSDFRIENMLSSSVETHTQVWGNEPMAAEDLQVVIDGEVDAIGALIAANRARSEARDAIIDDVDFHFTVIFQTTEQKLKFLELAGWLNTMDDENYNNQFINGLEIARRMGFDIPAIELPDLNFRGNPSKFRKDVIYHATEQDHPRN